MFVVMTLSVIVVDIMASPVGLFIKVIVSYSNGEL